MKALIATLALTACAPAYAQEPTCMGSADARAFLYEEYGEVSVGYGLDVSGAFVVEVFVSQHGSYTILGILADGRACLIGQGYEWVFVEEPWPPEGTNG